MGPGLLALDGTLGAAATFDEAAAAAALAYRKDGRGAGVVRGAEAVGSTMPVTTPVLPETIAGRTVPDSIVAFRTLGPRRIGAPEIDIFSLTGLFSPGGSDMK